MRLMIDISEARHEHNNAACPGLGLRHHNNRKNTEGRRQKAEGRKREGEYSSKSDWRNVKCQVFDDISNNTGS